MAKKPKNEIVELFKNKSKFSDELVIDLGDGASMTLGDLRAFNDEMGGSLAEQMKTEKAKLDAERSKVTKAAEEVANLYLNLEEEKKKLSATKPVINEDPWTSLADDPLAKVMKGFMEEVRGELKSTKDELGKVTKNLSEAGRTYMNDLARNQFESLRSDPDFSDEVKLDSLYDYAIKNGIKRSDGIPDLKKAFRDVTSERRTERLVKEASEKAVEAYKAEERKKAFMPPPGAHSGPLSPRDSSAGDPKQPPRTIREAVARAAQDPTIFGFSDKVN